MTAKNKNENNINAFKRAQADIARLAEWIEDELDKFEDDAVTWADVNTLEDTRQNLMETLASFSGVKLPEIQRSLDELHM